MFDLKGGCNDKIQQVVSLVNTIMFFLSLAGNPNGVHLISVGCLPI